MTRQPSCSRRNDFVSCRSTSTVASLFREIVRRDNLSAENHIHVDGSQANRIIHDYRLTEGFKSLLIDPKGRIVAMNPSIETLTKMSI